MMHHSDPPGHLRGAGRFLTPLTPRPRSPIHAQTPAKVQISRVFIANMSPDHQEIFEVEGKLEHAANLQSFFDD